MKFLFLSTLPLLFFLSCTENVFQTKSVQEKKDFSQQTSSTDSYSCGKENFHLVRPKVDLLIVWENTKGTENLIQQNKIEELQKLSTTLSERFDYHILLAPLIPSTEKEKEKSRLIAFNSEALSYEALKIRISQEDAPTIIKDFFNNPSPETIPSGLNRVISLLKKNTTNGIFRKKAYTIIVMIAIKDDKSYQKESDNISDQFAYMEDQLQKLCCLKGGVCPTFPACQEGSNKKAYCKTSTITCDGIETLNSQQMRFFSVIRFKNTENTDHSNCDDTKAGYLKNKEPFLYKQFSHAFYGLYHPIAPDLEVVNDVYNICNSKISTSSIFEELNNSIQEIVIGHTYNFWPIANTGVEFEANSVAIYTNDGTLLKHLPDDEPTVRDSEGKNDSASGYHIIPGDQVDKNTRFLPTVGEPHTGQFIELFGTAKITFPACINKIIMQSKFKYFDLVHLKWPPNELSIVLSINNRKIPKSGWRLLKDKKGEALQLHDHPIEINESPEQNIINTSPKEDGVRKSGYFLKLTQEHVYNNNAVIDVIYRPASQ